MKGPEDALVNVPGSAHIFILPIDEKRDQRIAQVRAWAARKNDDPAWNTDGDDKTVKILVIVHRMAANRLGFGDLYAALNDKAPEKFKTGFLDGTAWPVRPFNNFVLPLARASKNGSEFEVMQILRSQSPLLARENLSGVNIAERLGELRRFTETLQAMMEPASSATNAEVLRHIYESGVIAVDPRVLSYLDRTTYVKTKKGGDAEAADDEDDGEELTKEVAAMDAFLACPASQCWGYSNYVSDNSPFSTQQGIKGTEFERVLVVLDDDEGTHVQFSYDKYLGIKQLSGRDEANKREGKETTVDRTRRLFYVCCTRAMKDLIVVLFAADVAAAQRQITARGLFPADAVHVESEIVTN
jgi:DNA helicase-2/ATP-dependent DNA helicase PcrA